MKRFSGPREPVFELLELKEDSSGHLGPSFDVYKGAVLAVGANLIASAFFFIDMTRFLVTL